MKKDNKIISFNSAKNKRKTANKYELMAKISADMGSKNEAYKINWYSPDPITSEDIYLILSSIFKDLSKTINQIEIDKRENYQIRFTLLYYENIYNKEDIKYICIPKEITKEKLTQYLFIMLNIYELKQKGKL